MTIKDFTPMKDYVFVTNLEHGQQKTKTGIIIMDDDMKDNGIKPRWAQVYKVGDKCTDLSVGDWVLIEHGRWTSGFDVEPDNGEKVRLWRIDYPEGILLVSETDPRQTVYN